MHTTRRLAVIAVCSLPLLLAGCTTAVPTPEANVAVHHVASESAAHADETATQPRSNPVQVMVVGTVRSLTGAPIDGAAITIRPSSAPPDCIHCEDVSARTDSAGRFVLTLSRGDYLITCLANGGTPCRLEGEATPGPFTVTEGTRSLLLTTAR